MRVDPQIRAGLELGDVDEGTVVRRTVDFLLEYQDVPDFPRVVELEDVLASYSEFVARLRAA